MLLLRTSFRVLLLLAFLLAGFAGIVACQDCGHDDETASAMQDGCHCLCHQTSPMQSDAAAFSVTPLQLFGISTDLQQAAPSGPCAEIEHPPQIV